MNEAPRFTSYNSSKDRDGKFAHSSPNGGTERNASSFPVSSPTTSSGVINAGYQSKYNTADYRDEVPGKMERLLENLKYNPNVPPLPAFDPFMTYFKDNYDTVLKCPPGDDEAYEKQLARARLQWPRESEQDRQYYANLSKENQARYEEEKKVYDEHQRGNHFTLVVHRS